MPARPILKLLKSNKIIFKYSEKLASPRWKLVSKYFKKGSLLEIGVGMGTFANLANNNGYKVTGLDIDNTSLYKSIQPVLYNGFDFPFANDTFVNASLICVLHHCKNQERILQEAMRTARRVVVIEDTYRNSVEHILISIRDSIENWEFYQHKYRSYNDWKSLCKANGWKVKHIKSWSSWDFGILYGHQTAFLIEK